MTAAPGLGAGAAAEAGGFAPVLIGAVVALPFLGFLVNGAAALWAPRRKAIPAAIPALSAISGVIG